MSCAEPHSPSPFRVEHPHFPERSFNRTIYDAHAHIFPEKIAEKACINIGKFYSVPMYAVGLLRNPPGQLCGGGYCQDTGLLGGY